MTSFSPLDSCLSFYFNYTVPSVQFSRSVVSNSSWPHGLQHTRSSGLYYLPEFAQIHVHWVSDAIQPSHPLEYPSPSAFILSQHQSLFQGVSFSHQVAKVLKFQLQHQSFQWVFRTDFLEDDWLDLLAVQGLSRVFSSTRIQNHHYLALSLLYGLILTSGQWLLEKP